MYTFSKQLWGLHSPSTCSVQNFQIFTGVFFFSYLHSPHMFQDSLCIQLLSKHMLGSKFTNFHMSSFFSYLNSPTYFRIHSPYSYLVNTLQAHVRFQIFKFSRGIIFSCLHSPHVSGFTLHTVIWFTLSKHMLVNYSRL